MHPSLSKTKHRPWKLPTQNWSWRQSWNDLLFAHWKIPKEILEPLVPKPLNLQQFNGETFIGVVPFKMEGVTRRPLPHLPWVSNFCELNIRLYVEYQNKPGVFFLSLDATNPLAVWAGRKLFHLPYKRAKMSVHQEKETFIFKSIRKEKGDNSKLAISYQSISEVFEAQQGTLDYFLTERYCLYSISANGDLFRVEVHHRPWPLERALCEIEENTLFKNLSLPIHNAPDTLHFSRGVDIIAWGLEKLSSP